MQPPRFGYTIASANHGERFFLEKGKEVVSIAKEIDSIKNQLRALYNP